MRLLSLACLFCLACSPTTQAASIDLDPYATKDFLLGTAPTGCMPKGMKLDPKGQYLYVAEMCGRRDPVTKERVPTAGIYDLAKRSLYKVLVTPKGISKGGIFANTEVEFSVDRKWAMITRAEGDSNSQVFKNFGMLTVVSVDTQKIAKYIPVKGEGAKIVSARPMVTGDFKQIIYVANYFSDDISILDVAGLKDDGKLDGSSHYLKKIALHTNFVRPMKYLIAPRGVAFTPDGKYAIILSTETGSIIIVDAINHRQLAELAPMSVQTAGRVVNVRHIVITKDGQVAYLSHMAGNAVSRINLQKLIAKVEALPMKGPTATLPTETWEELLIPFQTNSGPKKILVLEGYPKDHPNFPNQNWRLAHPNTIVLDPVKNRYLYISYRTTSNEDYNKVDPKIMGKIDVLDTATGNVVVSLVGGSQPTALEVSHDNSVLISSGFMNEKLYFFDLKKILSLYEK